MYIKDRLRLRYMKPVLALLIMICILPIVSGDLFPTEITTVSIGGGVEMFGVNIQLPPEIFNSSAADSNDTQFWITDIGPLRTVNATQFNNIAQVLNIDESWVNSLWCQLTGCTFSGDIDMGGNDINNVGNATVVGRLFLGDSGHWIKRGAEGFDGISSEAFALQHEEERPAGTITFIVTANKTNSDIDEVNIMAQSGRNNSGGYLGNSWMIAPNNLTINLSDLSNCFFVINETGNVARISCDTSDTGADLFVQDDIQSGGTVFADGGIRAETLVDFIMNGGDVNVQNGSIHIFTPVTFEQGVTQGDEVTTFIEDFTGGLGSFTNLQSDLGNWFPTANILCDDGDCANAVGISGVGNLIMEANISTVNINSTSLNFIYSLINILGFNDFEVTVNNNVGSGEVSIFTDSTNDVALSSQSIALPASMSNQPKVSIRFNCDVTSANRQCFVDTISVNGTAIATTLTNVSGFNSVWKMSDGALAADGFPERGIFYVAENDTIVIRGNATFENIIEQDLNVTNSITLNSTTIFDWGDIPDFLLLNGSSVMSGDIQTGAFGINGSGDITTTGDGTFNNLSLAFEGVIDFAQNVFLTHSINKLTLSADIIEVIATSLIATGMIQAEQITSTDNITMQGHLLTLGDSSANDIILRFLGSSNSADFVYDESADRFQMDTSQLRVSGNIITDTSLQMRELNEGHTTVFKTQDSAISTGGTIMWELFDNAVLKFRINNWSENPSPSIIGLDQDLRHNAASGATFGKLTVGGLVTFGSLILGEGTPTVGNWLLDMTSETLGTQTPGENGSDGKGVTFTGADGQASEFAGISGDGASVNFILGSKGIGLNGAIDGEDGIFSVSNGNSVFDGDLNITGKLFVETTIENNGTFLTHSPSLFCGVQEGICFGIDYVTKETDWCQKDGKGDWYCDNNNVEILKKLNDINIKEERKENCLTNKYSFDGGCYENIKNPVDYNTAVEFIQTNETKLADYPCLKLNSTTLMVEETSCFGKITTDKIVSVGKFRDGCGWEKGLGYYCEVRELR